MPSADNPGKGSRRRPSDVSQEEVDRRWEQAFRRCIHVWKYVGWTRKCIHCGRYES